MFLTSSSSAYTCTGSGISCLWTNGDPASNTCTGNFKVCYCTDAWCNIFGFAHDAYCGPCRQICGGGTSCQIGSPTQLGN